MGEDQKKSRHAKAKTHSVTDSHEPNHPSTLDGKVDYLIQKLDDLSVDNKLLLEKVDKLVNENFKMQSEINVLKSQINDFKQQQLSDHLFITGVPVNEQENLSNIVGDICDLLKLDSSNFNITSVHRVKPARSTNDRDHNPIIVKFGKSAAAASILNAQKINGHIFVNQLPSTSNSTRSSANKKINIFQHLTSYNSALLMRMKKFAHDNNYKFVWFNKYCKIRKSEGSRVHSIKSFADFDKLTNSGRTGINI